MENHNENNARKVQEERDTLCPRACADYYDELTRIILRNYTTHHGKEWRNRGTSVLILCS